MKIPTKKEAEEYLIELLTENEVHSIDTNYMYGWWDCYEFFSQHFKNKNHGKNNRMENRG